MFAHVRRRPSSSRLRVFARLLVFAVPAIALVPLAASGEPKPAKAATGKAEKSERYDPDNITSISLYMETLVKANERYMAKDVATAIDTYKKAIELSPKNAYGHFLIADAYLGMGNLPEAEASIGIALELADSTPKNALLRSKVLFLSADIYEREKKWEQAKTAWQVYIDHSSKLGPDGGAFPQTGAARIRAIQRVLDQEKAYAAVRQRIQSEKDAAKAAPPPKK